MKKIFLLVLTFIFVFSFSGCSYFIKEISPSGANESVECPNFVGMTFEEVKNHELYNSFVFKLEYVKNNEYDTGVVCDQSFAPGRKLKLGTTITIYISRGTNTVVVPNVNGKTESYAKTELESHGFTVAIKKLPHDEVEAGHVIVTEPEQGVYWAEGAEILVYISTGVPQD